MSGKQAPAEPVGALCIFCDGFGVHECPGGTAHCDDPIALPIRLRALTPGWQKEPRPY
jgi:hypothetical protein